MVFKKKTIDLSLFDFLNSIESNFRALKGVDYKSIKLTGEVKERWENVSYLDGIDYELKEKCILSFERFAAYLVNDYKSLDKVFKTRDEENYWLSFAFCSIRHIITKTNTAINPDDVIHSVFFISRFFDDKALDEAEKRFVTKNDFEYWLIMLICRCTIGEMVEGGEYKLSKNYKKK